MKEKKLEDWLNSRSYLQALILDSLIDKDEKTFQDIFDYSVPFYSKFHENLPAVLLFVYLKELDHLDLVEVTKIPTNPKEFNMFNLKSATCKITTSGLTAIRNQSFHGVATSAFQNRQANVLSRRVLFLSIITMIIAVTSIYISVLISMSADEKSIKLINAIESSYKYNGEPITVKVDSFQLEKLLRNQQKADSIMMKNKIK